MTDTLAAPRDDAAPDIPDRGLSTRPPLLDEPLPRLSKFDVLRAVGRRSGAHVIEATIIPGVLFYTCLVIVGLGGGYVAAAGWTYAAVGRRVVCRRPVPPLLLLGAIGITARTVVAVASHSSFVYFFQPILATVAMGAVFLISVGVGHPLIANLANEFWPITPEVAARPGVVRLFRRLTLLWAAVNLVTAALTMSLLVSLPIGDFLAAKQVSGLAITAAAVSLTVSLSLDTARREGLAAAPARRGLAGVLAEPRGREATV